MKRKIFSKLLMVAMLVASVSMFVSCKDYDDDIKKNSDAISSLQQTLNNLQSALDQAKSDAATAHATFATKVELGQVDTAVKALQEEIKALATKTALEDAIAKVNDAIGKNATKEELAELSSMVAAINTDLDAIGEWQKTTDDAIKTANENIGKQEEALAALALVVAAGDQTNADAIAALKTALEKAIKDGDKANSDAIAALKTALEKSIAEGDNTNATAIAALEEVVGTKADAKALTDAVKELKEAIATKANQSALDALSKLVDAKATIASVDELKAALTEKIADAVTELENVKKTMATASDINDIKDAMKKADEAIKKNLDAINLLQVFIAKRLTSLVFIPDLYLDGIESVEVLALKDSILALQDEAKRTQVTEMWGVLLANNTIAVPDTAIAKWYKKDNKAWIYGPFNVGTKAVDWSKVAPAYYSYYPLATADYHINPTTANLEGVELSFFENVAKVEPRLRNTRSGDSPLAQPNPSKLTKEAVAEQVKNGILTVPFSVDREQLDAIRYYYNEDGDVAVNPDNRPSNSYGPRMSGNEAFIALQATIPNEKGDTTVTSDYALLSPADIDIVALGGKWLHNTPENHWFGTDHLWTKLIAGEAQGFENCPITSGYVLYKEGTDAVTQKDFYSPIKAFTSPYRLKVEYDGSVDLSKEVITHFREGFNSPVYGFQPSSGCQEMSEEMMKKLGLHYEFEAIHYISGSNKTDEWEHIQLSGENNCIATPRSVTDDGKRIDDQVAGREVIGRLPIVRANLVTEDGKVLMIGYILIEIVSKNIAPAAVVIDLPDAYMDCTAPAAITWSQVEALILAQVQLSKTEFEALYSLETVDMDGNFDGVFYENGVRRADDKIPSATVKKTAVQYVKQGNGWKSVFDINKAQKSNYPSSANTNAKKAALLTYPLGSVYEHVNTQGQQTTVLEWNVGSQVDPYIANTYGSDYVDLTNASLGGQPQALSIAKAIEASGASAASKGLSTETIEVTVAYKQKDENRKYIETNAIYVTLRIPAGKLHFAYAEAAGKDLSHWYQNNNYLNAASDAEADAAEIHINVPTPALGGSGATITRGTGNSAVSYAGLQDVDFGKVIDQTFIGNLVKMGGFDKDHFTKFVETQFSFHLVKPVLNKNASNLNAAKTKLSGKNNTSVEAEDSWIVKGVTGNEYLIHVSKAADGKSDSIIIDGYKDVVTGRVETIADKLERTVVILQREVVGAVSSGDTKGAKIALMPNRYAQDIINYTGRYDMFGTDNNTSYLDNENKTFTAFIEIESGNPCYQLMMPNSYFKARFLRPINVLRKTKEWTDAQNTVQTVKVAEELVKLIDWRGYTLTTANKDDNDITKCTVDAKFYGIADSTYKHFYVDTLNIYTDHGKAVGSRTILNSVEAIEALQKRDEFESLSPRFLNFDTDKGTLTYRNNETNVGTFHLYVPVYVAYSFGEFDYDGIYNDVSGVSDAARFNYKDVSGTALFAPWCASRDDDNTSVDDATSVADIHRPLYTLKTYAVIKVKQTTNSGTQTGARNK